MAKADRSIDPRILVSAKKEFLELWEKINAKSFYTVSFDTHELIQKAIDALDAHLNVSRIFVQREYGEQTAQIQSKEQLLQGEAFQRRKASQEMADRPALGSVRYDLIGKLVEETGLTRATIAAILQHGPAKVCHVPRQPGGFYPQDGQADQQRKSDLYHRAHHLQ